MRNLEESKLEFLGNIHGQSSGPGQLKTNWPFQDEQPIQKPLPPPLWFIDVGPVTVFKAKSVAEAKAFLKRVPGGNIRLYNPSEEERHKDVLDKKERLRQGISVR